MGHELVLDPDIRNWVLLPIVAIMVLVTLLRHFAQQLMTSEKPADAKQLALQNALARSQRLRGNGRFVAPSAFAMRRVRCAQQLCRAPLSHRIATPALKPRRSPMPAGADPA